jgi:antitoxin ParD1/3/4
MLSAVTQIVTKSRGPSWELERIVQSRVASGRYQTSSEVIREGLRLLAEREQERESALEELRAKIRQGIRQARCGKLLEDTARLEEIRQLTPRQP